MAAATAEERLLQLARVAHMGPFSVADIESPDWGVGSKCHNWRNYISKDLTELWPVLSLEAKLVAFIAAAEDAHREEWD